MTRLMQRIETLFLPTIAIVSLAISLGDVFNFFHLIPGNQVPMLTLILVSMALGALAVIQSKCNEMQRQMEHLLSKAELEQMEAIIGQINPDLRKVLGESFFKGMFHTLLTAMHENRVQVNDTNSFRLNFKHMLRAYPSATFLSTSSLAMSYLWNEKEMQEALARFIREGGKIKQIFFVHGIEEAAKPATHVTLEILEKIGVTVRIVDSTSIPTDLKQYFIVESRRKIGWSVSMNDGGHGGMSVITAAPTITSTYHRAFERLWEHAE